MCGIVGYIGRTLGRECLAASIKALSHRGPDGFGSVSVPSANGDFEVQLGHTRLSIQDLSQRGDQPMWSPSRRYLIAFNGEIYNHKELKQSFASSYEYVSDADTEVILHGLERFGWDVLDHLEGMFAITVWDQLLQRVTLVRDRFGEKPLYYFEGPSFVVVASEVRALLATELVPRKLCVEGLTSLLYFGSVCHPHTMVSGVKSIGPGEIWHYEPVSHQVTSRKYWQTSQLRERYSDRVCSFEELKREFERACSLTTVADTPLAILSSGGIDSSCSVIGVSGRARTAVETFHVRLHDDEGGLTDAAAAARLSLQLGIRHHEHRVTSSSLISLTRDAIAAMDQPSVDGINTFIISKIIKECGIKVAISGQGSDELFLGYSCAPKFGYLGLVRQLPSALVTSVATLVRVLMNRNGKDDQYSKMASILLDHGRDADYSSQHSVFSSFGVRSLLASEVSMPSFFISDPGHWPSPADRLSSLELNNYLHNTLLRDGDQMSMANSVEMRTPFLNHKFAAAAVSQSRSLFANKKRQRKWQLIKAMSSSLPDYIWNKPKRGFLAPFDLMPREAILDLFDPDCDPPINSAAYARLRGEFAAGQSFFRLFAVGVAIRWCRRNQVAVE
jgi:asparagine synthase (glutamine-hydrolysing)